jgi:hypothetical protein
MAPAHDVPALLVRKIGEQIDVTPRPRLATRHRAIDKELHDAQLPKLAGMGAKALDHASKGRRLAPTGDRAAAQVLQHILHAAALAAGQLAQTLADLRRAAKGDLRIDHVRPLASLLASLAHAWHMAPARS